MTIDATEKCVVCGQDAAPEHHEPFRSQGGTEADRYYLCRRCHEERHAEKWRLVPNGDFVSSVAPDGRVRTERALVANNDSQDTRYWTDDFLVMYAGQALERMADMAWEVVRCAFEFRRRYYYREDWANRLAQLIRDNTGLTRGYSARQLYDWATQYPAFKDNPDDWRLLQGRLSRAVAQDDNPQEAMGVATVARLDGQPVAAVVETLRERQGREPVEMCECTCDECGAVVKHRRKA